MGPANAAGPPPADLSRPAVPARPSCGGRIAAGEWVVDLRARRAFAAGHLPGSLSFEHGDASLTNLGWLLPAGAPLTLIGESPGQVADAQRDLTRIGVDRIAGGGTAHGPRLGGGVPLAVPGLRLRGAGRARRERPVAVLDVRRRLEWAAGHMDGALHIPLHELPGRLADLPAGDPVWVHCQGGYRAGVAASLLQAAGHGSPPSTMNSAMPPRPAWPFPAMVPPGNPVRRGRLTRRGRNPPAC